LLLVFVTGPKKMTPSTGGVNHLSNFSGEDHGNTSNVVGIERWFRSPGNGESGYHHVDLDFGRVGLQGEQGRSLNPSMLQLKAMGRQAGCNRKLLFIDLAVLTAGSPQTR
jgi:hypothetical protein